MTTSYLRGSSKKVTLDSTPEAIENDGFHRAKVKMGKDPIPPFLVGTVQYRQWMKGWNRYLEEHANNERKKNGTE